MSVRVVQTAWPATDLVARINGADAVVCTASLLAMPGDVERSLETLNSPERVRFAGFTNEVVARRYACGRRLLREILGGALQLEAGEVPLREGMHGKPYLAAGTPGALWFSLSHTDDLLVVALSRVADIGVDVERSRAFEQWQRVADRVLGPQERQQLESAIAMGDDPSDAFLRHWCRVEAELKAIGCGIAGLEAHLAGVRPRGLRLADLVDLPLPPDVAASGVRYQAAVALCVPGAACVSGAESARQIAAESRHDAAPTSNPASASTP